MAIINTLNTTQDIFLKNAPEKVPENADWYQVVQKPDVKKGIYARY